MDWLRNLFGMRERSASREPQRWVVVDTETSGTDGARDALLAIGGVAVDDQGVRIADSFEIVVRHTGATSAENVAIHGLGRDALNEGVSASEALRAFAAWVDGAPCCGFHVDFDRQVLDRAAALAGTARVSGPWLDIAPLCVAFRPDVAVVGTGTFDDWLAAYGLCCPSRHNAAADALSTAELLLCIRSLAAKQRSADFASLAAVQRQRRWLGAQR